MPLDPAISLGVTTPNMTAMNPLGMVGQFATIQNALNQNRLFQQSFAARQRAGEILSTAPDMESGITALMRDPLAAPFAPQIINSIREGQLTLTQIQKTQQEIGGQAQSALGVAVKAMAGAYNNPAGFNDIVQSQLQAMGPQLAQKVAPALESVRKSILDGVDLNSPGALDKVRTNILSQTAPYLNSDQMYALAGVMPPGVHTYTGPQGENITRVLGGIPGFGATQAGLGGGIGAPAGASTGVQAGLGGAPGGSAPGGAAGMLGIGPSIQKAETEKGIGQAGGELNQEMMDTAQALPGTIKRLDMMQQSLGQFQAGGLATYRSKVATLLQGLRNAGADWISDDFINKVGNSSLPATQIFENEIKPFMLSELKDVSKGTGRVMKSEVDTFLRMADPNIDPRALVPIINQAKFNLQVDYDRVNKFVNFKQAVANGDPAVKGLSVSDFPAWYLKQLSPRNLPTQTGGGMNIGPMSMRNALGAVPAPTTAKQQAAAAPAVKGRPPLTQFISPPTAGSLTLQ